MVYEWLPILMVRHSVQVVLTLWTHPCTVNRGASAVSFGPSLSGGIETRLKQVGFSDTSEFESGYDITAIGRSADSSHALGLVGGLANDQIRVYGYYSDEQGSDRDFADGEVDNTLYDRQVYGLGAGFRQDNGEWEIELRRQDTGPTGNPSFAMDIDYVETDFARLRYETTISDTQVAIALGYSDVEHGMNNFELRPAPPLVMRYRQTRAEATTYTINLDLSTPFSQGELGYGVDLEQGEHAALISNPQNAAFYVTSIPSADQDRIGAYVNWEQEVGPGNMELGLRLDRYSDSAINAATGPALPAMAVMLATTFNQSDRDWNDTTVDLLARYWQETDIGTFRVSLARKNRAPMYLERFGWLPLAASAGLADGNNYVGDLNLDVETAHIAELGIDLAGRNWWLRPGIFYQRVDDYIQGTSFDGTPGVIDSPVEMVSSGNGDATPLQFSNVEARLFGIDADYGWQLAENWRLEGVLSIVRGERRDISDDLYRISPDRLSLSLVYEQPQWSVSLASEGIRQQNKVSTTNSEAKTSGYGLMHLFANWQLNDQLQLSGGVENLFDRDYEQHLAGYNRVQNSDVAVGDRLPGTGRNLFLKVSFHR